MKKCPYCAEEIQDAAIVCRYCGRELVPLATPQVTEAPRPEEQLQEVKPSEAKPHSSAWKQRAKISAVLTALAAIGIIARNASYPSNPAEFLGILTSGLIFAYLFWWLVGSGIVWLWRQAGAWSILILVGIIIIGIAVSLENTNASAPPPSTSTLAPRSTPRPDPAATRTPPPIQMLSNSNCKPWFELRDRHIGRTVCVQGIVDSITGNNENSAVIRIYFRSNLPDGYVWADGTPNVFYFVDDTYYYRDLEKGDCVTATGNISVNDDGVLFMRLDGNLNMCP